MTDLERAYAALAAKNATYTTLWSYYRNQAPLTYTNERLKEVFRNLDARFTENWCAVVVDAVADRINITGCQVEGAAQTALDAVWDANDMSVVADDAHEAALICGEAFVVVWPNAAGQVRAYYNDPRLCHVFYNADDPYTVDMAAKWYNTADGKRRIVLYYPDRLDYFTSTVKSESVTAASAFQADNPPSENNPFGEVPVFHLRTRHDIRSELENVTPLQNGINKLLADMMVSAEFGAFNQRVFVTNADTRSLKNAPGQIITLPAGTDGEEATQVHSLSATDLGTYLEAIDKLSQAIGIITRTPKHYFYAQGGDPSGEALIAMEAPLVKKCGDYIARFRTTWRNVAAFMLKLTGQTVDPTAITPAFESPQTVQPRTQAEMRKLSVDAGVPLVTALRREGWTDAEIVQMEKDRDADSSRQQATLASALVDAQRRMDAGGDQPKVPPPVTADA